LTDAVPGKLTDTGAYTAASPTSNDCDALPPDTATGFCRRPLTALPAPAPRPLPPLAITTLLAPVAIRPLVNASVPLTVASFASVTPAALAIVRWWKVVAPGSAWALEPLNSTTRLFGVNDPAFVQAPPTRRSPPAPLPSVIEPLSTTP